MFDFHKGIENRLKHKTSSFKIQHEFLNSKLIFYPYRIDSVTASFSFHTINFSKWNEKIKHKKSERLKRFLSQNQKFFSYYVFLFKKFVFLYDGINASEL